MDTKVEAVGLFRLTFCQGGSSVFKVEEMEKVPFNDKLQAKGLSDKIEYSNAINNDGWFGWMGFGGSSMKYHPELRLSVGYTCSHF